MRQLQKIVDLLKKVMDDNFWGEVIIKFRNGKPVLILTTSQTKLD